MLLCVCMFRCTKTGTAVEDLGRTKIRTSDAIITVPDERHYNTRPWYLQRASSRRTVVRFLQKQLNLLETEPLDEAQWKKFRSAVGSAGDIQFAVKEAARRMSRRRKCDMQSCEDPGSILAGTSHRVTGQKVEDCGPSSFTATVTGQDAWRRAGHRQPSCHCGRGGCDLHNSNPTGFTSNFFARCGASRSCSRAAQEGIFLKDLVSSLSTLGRRAGSPAYGQIIHRRSKLQKRIGPGAKLRHLEVCEFYVQGTLQAKLLSLGKAKGTVNCANFLTKHPKCGTEARQALPGLGMYELQKGEDILSTSKHINVKVSQITKEPTWKTPIPASVAWTCLLGERRSMPWCS